MNCVNLRCSTSDEWHESVCQDWGEWSDEKECPAGMKICGAHFKFQEYLGAGNGDDTALNGVEFLCC